MPKPVLGINYTEHLCLGKLVQEIVKHRERIQISLEGFVRRLGVDTETDLSISLSCDYNCRRPIDGTVHFLKNTHPTRWSSSLFTGSLRAKGTFQTGSTTADASLSPNAIMLSTLTVISRNWGIDFAPRSDR